jgi:hypothetical protein
LLASLERAISLIVKEDVRAETGNEHVGKSVVVIVSDGDAGAIAIESKIRWLSYLAEMP